MTPHEKAVHALNTRLERLQANLRDATVESARAFLFQSIVVTVGVGEALNDYLKAVGSYAQRRHGTLKQTNETLAAQHAALLKSGQELLEQFKANPADRALRQQIARVQQQMEQTQKTLRRAANTLQRDLAPSLALIDELAVSVRRFSEADDPAALKRVLKTFVAHASELYRSQPDLPAKGIVQAEAWHKIVTHEIEQGMDFYDAYARAGYQVLLAFELMTMTVAENPPPTEVDATRRGTEAVAARIKEITGRFAAS
jgi:hypothetical protein